MGIALFAFSSLFAPLQAATSRFAPTQTHTPRSAARHAPVAPIEPSQHASPRNVSVHIAATKARAPARPDGPLRRPPTLRVIRNIEAGVPVGHSGRMVISGRMADVCAELDRLATLENNRRGTTRQAGPLCPHP